jgi:predicted nucleotidyltransferase
MKRQQALDLLQRSRDELRERFGVTRLALFGSVARGMATPDFFIRLIFPHDEYRLSNKTI